MANYDKLKGFMRERHVTQSDIAKLLGVKECTVSQKLNGYRRMYLWEAKKISDYLEIPQCDFCKFFCS